MNFIKPQKQLQSIIKNYLKSQSYGICDFTIGCLYMWENFYNCHICIENDTFYTRIDNTEKPNNYIYTVPLCDDFDSGLLRLMDYERSCGRDSLVLTSVTKSTVERLTERFGDKCTVGFLRDLSDYVYSAEKLAFLSGHQYNKKRNLVKQFEKLYPNYVFEPIVKQNAAKIIAAYKSFRIHNDTLMGSYDEIHTERMIEEYFDFDFLSGVLSVDGNIVAFTVGEVINDMLYVHIEKANIQYKGAYQMVNMLFAKSVYESHKISMINRAEDLGDEGLRKSKESYHPIHLAEKYKVEIKL